MIEDVHEPLELYAGRFKQQFAENAAAAFQELAAASGVDAELNSRTVTERNAHILARDEAGSSRSLWGFLYFLAVCIMLVGLYPLFDIVFEINKIAAENRPVLIVSGLVSSLGMLLLIIFVIHKKFVEAGEKIQLHNKAAKEKENQAWQQMAPLNELYAWDIAPKLIEKTVPRLQFDRYFTSERLKCLKQHYGMGDLCNETSSILFSLSGVINSNPFVIVSRINQIWTQKTYTGTKTIHWKEREIGSDGKMRTVRKSEVLYASVTKPAPDYYKDTSLIYGNEAAPNLNFSRVPSDLSGQEEGFFNNLRRRSELKELEDFSRNLEDESQYTMMANKDFELLFHSTDRSSEVDFRLLFTPLAQSQMVKLLNDREIGYGDDFTFVKIGKVNYITPAHLNGSFMLNTTPSQFADFDFNRAKINFCSVLEEYFRAVYFAFAPLLCIPLYQQTPPDNVTFGLEDYAMSEYPEHEALANEYGYSYFAPKQCVTQCILKTSIHSRKDGISDIRVTAYGFKGVKRVEYVSVFGGDGNFHNVPVEWIEYLPVDRTTRLWVMEQDGDSKLIHSTPDGDWVSKLEKQGISLKNAIYRRSIISCLDR